MPRYKLTLCYDGSAYSGWQTQPRRATVQQTLEEAIARITGEKTVVHGSGRTDSGVHARMQVAHIDLGCPRTRAALKRGLNAVLPQDVRILKIDHAAPDFHARKNAIGKEYRYFIWNGEVMPPFLRLYRHHVRDRLDVARMRKACAYLAGKRDFAAFTANPNREVTGTVRRLDALSVRKNGREIVITARGEGFLYRMVRSLAGFLERVGSGLIDPRETVRVLRSKARTSVVPTAPAKGLFLWKVTYETGKRR